MLLSILTLSEQLLNLTYETLVSLATSYGYIALLGLMILEAASFPVPSEVVLPFFGTLSSSSQYHLNVFIVIIVTYLGSLIGMAIDYYVAYFLGKDVIYRHLHIFHIKRESFEAFEKWFAKNGNITVFVSRLLPVIRGPISFVAGFAEMNQKDFYAYSMLGSIIWNTVLVMFGYFAIGSGRSAAEILLAIGVFATAVYMIYYYAMKGIRKSATKQPS